MEKTENPWIIKTDEDIKDFIVELREGRYGIISFGATLKHVELFLDNLFIFDEDLEREVLGSLKASLRDKQLRFVGDDKMTCFLVAYLYQLIKIDDMFGDVIYIREEVHREEWIDDDNNDQNQNNNGKDSSKD